MYLLLRLLLAHIITDFFLQPRKWVADKNRKKIKSGYLILHAVSHGLVAYLFLADWKNVGLPLLIIPLHWAIDLLKVYRKKQLQWFVLDQVLHTISIVILWALFYKQIDSIWHDITSFLGNEKMLWLVTGYILILNPTALFIDNATRKWQKEINKKNKNNAGLTQAGKWIGILERILTLTFILINQFAAIGFLITAKSIFRFGDLTKKKEQKRTEYILIGTFLSFVITLFIGLFIKQQIQ